MEGLCLALADWSAELRLIRQAYAHGDRRPSWCHRIAHASPRLAHVRAGHDRLAMWSHAGREIAQNVEEARRGRSRAGVREQMAAIGGGSCARRFPAWSSSPVSPIFLPSIPLMNPRTLWACQPVAFMISARVAPSGCLSSSRIFAVLLPSRAAPLVPFAFAVWRLSALWVLSSAGWSSSRLRFRGRDHGHLSVYGRSRFGSFGGLVHDTGVNADSLMDRCVATSMGGSVWPGSDSGFAAGASGSTVSVSAAPACGSAAVSAVVASPRP